VITSDLPNDRDMIKALGSAATPMPLFTDACFTGFGPDNRTTLIAFERKKVGDFCQCMNDGRLVFQLRNNRASGAGVSFVVIEGRTHRNADDGLLEIPVWGISPRTGRPAEIWQPVRPATSYSRFCQYRHELVALAGVYVMRSDDVRETAAIIVGLWPWFQKPHDGHGSLNVIFKRPPPVVQLVRPSLVRRVACELDGIGWERSGAVVEHFKTVEAMVAASVKDWERVPGIGKVTARKAVEALHGGVPHPEKQVQTVD
ncbi:MAG: helix-hairpin-helix domain-containing protein, partial [Sphaerochaetaceae bacterium]|nr:helix-hairpin-helix domain-containing protein [Sphaerochaetaceae bacterium]